MPLSHTIARFNRRGINRLTKRFAGRVPPFAMLHHIGRTSGKAYATPIMVFRRGDGFVICLTYGERTDWLRNLNAGGGGALDYGGERWCLGTGRLTHGSAFGQPLPRPVQRALSAMRVKDFLHIEARECKE